MSLHNRIVCQFKRPSGLMGSLAGYIMANRPSNRQRNLWTLDLLALEAHHKVLEFGCGPGFALKACAEKASHGYVIGIDHSQVMICQARKRLAGEIKNGRAEVRLGEISDVTFYPDNFDRVFSANVVQFLPALDQDFAQINNCLVAGGMVASTYQPRSKNATREQALEMALKIENAMNKTGFINIERHELPLKPVPAVCVIGVRS